MQIRRCVTAILKWFQQSDEISVDDLVCEGLIDFSESDVLYSLSWLSQHKLICCPNDPNEAPFLIVPGGIAFSEKQWSLTELAALSTLNIEMYSFDDS